MDEDATGYVKAENSERVQLRMISPDSAVPLKKQYSPLGSPGG